MIANNKISKIFYFLVKVLEIIPFYLYRSVLDPRMRPPWGSKLPLVSSKGRSLKIKGRYV